jgi:hypothetical protein
LKRRALLIGNSQGLQGVTIDVQKMSGFLQSRIGGAWYPHEIQTLLSPEKRDLMNTIAQLRAQNNDYVIALFTGHGGHKRQTILEINARGETIGESDLLNIAKKQLSVFDCCRVVQQEQVLKSYTVDSATILRESLDSIRERYEARIQQAIDQQAILYSCAVGQCSYDTPSGAIYLGNLLSAAASIDASAQFKTVGAAHDEARVKTIDDVRRLPASSHHGSQTPEAILPKCLTSQQLIISVR